MNLFLNIAKLESLPVHPAWINMVKQKHPGEKNNNNSEEHAQSNYERGPGLSTESRGLKLSGTDQFERGMPA